MVDTGGERVAELARLQGELAQLRRLLARTPRWLLRTSLVLGLMQTRAGRADAGLAARLGLVRELLRERRRG